MVATGAAGGYVLLTRTQGSAEQTAATYLSDWQRGSYAAIGPVGVNVPPSGLASPLRQTAAELGLRGIHLRLGRVTESGGSARARYTATADLATGHTWTYPGQLQLVTRNRHWRVDWSPAAIYPRLKAGERFALHAVWPARAAVLASDGTALSSPSVLAQSGSIALLTGTVVAATAAQAKSLGPPYQKGDLIGQGGIEQAYQAQAGGLPALSIQLEGTGTPVNATAARFPATPGKPVRTSLDTRDEMAASAAVSAASTSKPIDLVAIQPSTGKVLAVASGRAGSTAPWPASSRPARRSRWSPRRPWPRSGCARPARFSAPARSRSAAAPSTTTTISTWA